MVHLSKGHRDWPNQLKNSLKQCNETGYPVVSMMESQWKLRQQYDQNFNGGKAIVEQILVSEERNKCKKSRTVRITVKDLSRKINHLSKVYWDRKIINDRVHPIYQFHQNR